MKKTIDRICFWEGFGSVGNNFKWETVCRIRIYEENDRAVVVAMDVADPIAYPNGTGTSITNCAENLARLICGTFGLDPEQLVWIEHYSCKPGYFPTKGRKVSHRFAEVQSCQPFKRIQCLPKISAFQRAKSGKRKIS